MFRSVNLQLRAAPYVSVVLTGRNDGYGGDFIDRFFRTLRFNLQQFLSRGITHEVVFVEWAPQPGRPLLVQRVFDEVPELAPANTSWYAIDPLYQDALSLNPRLEYLEFPAKNVGIRRARGEFILTSNCDVFFGRRVIEVLEQRALAPGVLYRAPRHDIDLPSGESTIDWDLLEDPAVLAGPAHQLKPPFMCERWRDDFDLGRPALTQDTLRLVGEEFDDLDIGQCSEIEAAKSPQPWTAEHTARFLGEMNVGDDLSGTSRDELQIARVRSAVDLEELRRVEEVSPGRRQEFVDQDCVVAPSHRLQSAVNRNDRRPRS